MADEESIFDPSLKKKKKKPKKTPFCLDSFQDGGTGENSEVLVTDAQEKEDADKENKEKEDELSLDLEFSGLKKKKKPKKHFNLEDLENALPDPSETVKEMNVIDKESEEGNKGEGLTNDDDLNFNLPMKKRKKKKINIEDLASTAINEDEIDNAQADGDPKSKSGDTSWTGTDRDYTYEELLTRVFDIMKEKNPDMIAGEKRRFVMRPPQVVRIGTKKTSFANFTEICKMLHRQPKHLLAFLLAELGTSGSVDGNNQLIIKGRFQQKQIENVLRRYIKEYVTCHTCHSPNTILQKDTRLFFLQCESCGSRCSVASIKSGFQAVTSKRAAIRAKTA